MNDKNHDAWMRGITGQPPAEFGGEQDPNYQLGRHSHNSSNELYKNLHNYPIAVIALILSAVWGYNQVVKVADYIGEQYKQIKEQSADLLYATAMPLRQKWLFPILKKSLMKQI